MAKRDWLGLKHELPQRRRVGLTVLSFLVPLLLWCAVSYIPWLWHPLGRVTNAGEVDWLTEGLELPRGDFEQEVAKAKTENLTPPEGYRVNPVYLPAPHDVARAFYTAFTTPP